MSDTVASKNLRTRAFISYSPKDQRYLYELHSHLAHYIHKENLNVWDDTKIPPGAKWREEIEKALQSTKVAILLVSADFLASESIANNQLPVLLTAAKEEGAIIYCVILRPCAFIDTELAQFRTVNDPSKPIGAMNLAQRDAIWNKVAELVRQALSGRNERSSTISLISPVYTPSISKSTTRSNYPSCDICVICAKDEEVEAFTQAASHLYSTAFHSAIGPRTKRNHLYTTIQNKKGETLTLYVTWPPDYGPEETSLHLKPVLEELQPRFAAMTGICAGDKKKVVLGDIIIANRAFRYDTGKITLDNRGRKVQQYDVGTYNPHPDILQFARMFDSWKAVVAELKRPISKHQQRDWLLSTLLQEATPQVDNIPLKKLEQHAPDWKKIVHELQSGSNPYLKADRSLRDEAKVRELYFGQEDFPFRDPEQPERYIAPLASGSAVHSDNPFEQIQVPVRGAIALDMEGAAFYRIVAEFSNIRSLLVKGVSDYADPDKDDSYHKYSATVSAIYMLSFIKEYVNIDRMPNI